MARRLSLALLVVGLCSCAKVAAPKGGPVDKYPPRILSTVPVADRTGVAQDTPLTIEFNEPMDRRTTENAVYIAPATSVEVTWDGPTRLKLWVEGGLAADRTYVITIGTDAKDRRGNRMEASHQFAFSTGTSLDQGTMVGRVVSVEGPQRGVSVWAYDLENFDGIVGTDAPAYVTQSGSDGRFRFERLAPTSYRLLAYVDEDRDRTLGEREARGLAATDIEVTSVDSTVAGDLHLVPAPWAPRLERLTALTRHRLLLVFEAPVEVDSVRVEIENLGVESIYSGATDLQRVYVQTEEQSADQSYRPVIRVAGRAAAPHVIGDVDEFRGSSRVDSRAPNLVHNIPGPAAIHVDELVFTFDEAMAATLPADSFWQADDSTQVFSGHWQWRGPLHLVYALTDPLPEGQVRMRGAWSQVADLAGNTPTEPVQVELEVLATEDRPSLEVAMSLEATIDPSSVRVVATTSDRRYLFELEDLDTALSGLPFGEYQVYGFADIDGDSQHDPGAVHPFRVAEPFGWLGSVDLRPSTTIRADLHIH
ncbi:MAG: hypothetical protein HOJ45_05695 [Gemmatimonadetes bacterium]|nr:hypothetical protein [Gemmatimonadota bacterium]